MTQAESPPAFHPVDPITLSSVADSKIIGVSVYANRAEVTRLFKFKAGTGQNQVVVNGLPSVLDQDSLKSVLKFFGYLRHTSHVSCA